MLPATKARGACWCSAQMLTDRNAQCKVCYRMLDKPLSWCLSQALRIPF